MAGPGIIFREIHRLRRNVKDLSAKIDQGPKQVKTQQAAVALAEEKFKKAQDELKHLKVNAHEKEVSLRATSDQIKKYEGQLAGIISKKEYDAIKNEVATCQNLVSKLEDEILALLSDIEQRQAKLPEQEKSLTQLKAQAAQFERDHGARMADFTRQRDEVLKKLVEAEAGLADDVKPQYERLVNAKGEDAMSTVENKVCVACYTEITAQSYNDLMGGKFLLCKSCGRILYLSE
jgi:predicted  nucleic acid-binding Zn-ribbon protein